MKKVSGSGEKERKKMREKSGSLVNIEDMLKRKRKDMSKRKEEEREIIFRDSKRTPI